MKRKEILEVEDIEFYGGGEGSTAKIVDITFSRFYVRGCRIMRGKFGLNLVVPSSKKKSGGWKKIFELKEKQDFKNLQTLVLNEYRRKEETSERGEFYAF